MPRTAIASAISSHAGVAFIATRDNPGLPGHDHAWMPVSPRGTKGDKGERGQRGSKGERRSPALAIAEWRLDRERFCAVLFMTHGTAGPPLHVHGLFEEYQWHTSC
jgi:hypothetical protein